MSDDINSIKSSRFKRFSFYMYTIHEHWQTKLCLKWYLENNWCNQIQKPHRILCKYCGTCCRFNYYFIKKILISNHMKFCLNIWITIHYSLDIQFTVNSTDRLNKHNKLHNLNFDYYHKNRLNICRIHLLLMNFYSY